MIMGAAIAVAGPTAAILLDGLLFSAPVLADVKDGVDAWIQGDYARALAEWRPLAAAGDADAQFNMGQAYKLGRGVPTDMGLALDWFRRAATQGHARAEDNYGLLLFQQNRRQEAMPYIQKSAARGEARSQYILGTALFNGENIAKDWVRAYALMTRASASGLSQAAASLEQMDKYVPAEQRQKGLALATQMESQAKGAALAAAEAPSSSTPAKAAARPIRKIDLPPSAPVRTETAAVKVPIKTQVKVAAPAPAPAPGAGWRVQLGAFSEEGRAKSLWSSLSGKVAGLSAYQPYLVKGGAVTRLQAGPLRSAADAEKLCRAIKAAGTDCLTKKL